MILTFIGWALVGLIVGFLASRMVNLHGDEPLIGILCALGGAIVGGILYAWLGNAGLEPWTYWSLIAAAVGAIVAVAVYHLVRSRFISHEPQSVRRSY
jgi:uncharacterized membrane protein YeaQ/YmgE (transglycosylase-associated protein family)